MTDTLQQVADDLASHIGEMRVVMDEMDGAMKIAVSLLHGQHHPEQVEYGVQRLRRALSAYERVRKLYSIETAPTEVRKQAGDVS